MSASLMSGCLTRVLSSTVLDRVMRDSRDDNAGDTSHAPTLLWKSGQQARYRSELSTACSELSAGSHLCRVVGASRVTQSGTYGRLSSIVAATGRTGHRPFVTRYAVRICASARLLRD